MSRPLLPVGFREDSRNPGHVRVSIFIGRNPGARGRAGTVTIRTDEWDDFTSAVEDTAEWDGTRAGGLVEVMEPLDLVRALNGHLEELA